MDYSVNEDSRRRDEDYNADYLRKVANALRK